ncbi:hypothetical protein ACFZEN_004733, partial [Salmonella enterica]
MAGVEPAKVLRRERLAPLYQLSVHQPLVIFYAIYSPEGNMSQLDLAVVVDVKRLQRVFLELQAMG